jgi:hypothetical protein
MLAFRSVVSVLLRALGDVSLHLSWPTDVTRNVNATTRRSAVPGLAADGGRNRLGGGGRRGRPALAETSDLPGIASWRTPQPVNTGRQSVRQLKTGVGAVKDEGPAALTRPGAAKVRTQVQDLRRCHDPSFD